MLALEAMKATLANIFPTMLKKEMLLYLLQSLRSPLFLYMHFACPEERSPNPNIGKEDHIVLGSGESDWLLSRLLVCHHFLVLYHFSFYSLPFLDHRDWMVHSGSPRLVNLVEITGQHRLLIFV